MTYTQTGRLRALSTPQMQAVEETLPDPEDAREDETVERRRETWLERENLHYAAR